MDDEARDDAASEAVIVEGGLRVQCSETSCSGGGGGGAHIDTMRRKFSPV